MEFNEIKRLYEHYLDYYKEGVISKSSLMNLITLFYKELESVHGKGE